MSGVWTPALWNTACSGSSAESDLRCAYKPFWSLKHERLAAIGKGFDTQDLDQEVHLIHELI